MNIDFKDRICEGDEAAFKAREFLKSLSGMPFDEAHRSARIALSTLKCALERHSAKCTLGEITLTETKY